MIGALDHYLAQTRPEFRQAFLPYVSEFARPMPTHPGAQRAPNGLALHTGQVIRKALELNQEFAAQEIIECCLAHDLKHWPRLPLTPCQVTAIRATRGLAWKHWRRTPHYRFVALILIADMWSAYINVEGDDR